MSKGAASRPCGRLGRTPDPNHGHEHLAWVGIDRGDLAFAAEHASASRQWTQRTTDPATRAESLSTFAMVQFLNGRPAQDLMTEAVRLEDLAMEEGRQ